MPPERPIRRQEPASCQSCRKKKLRCDRSLPCHNCQTRAIQCQYEGRRPPDAGEVLTIDVSPDLRAENEAIKARLKRLEDIIYSRESSKDGFNGEVARNARSSSATAAGLRSPPITTEANTPEAEQTKGYSEDSRWLESIGSRGGSSSQLPHLANDNIHVQILPLVKIAAATAGTTPHHIMIPTLLESSNLFQSYLEHVDCLQHIIYVPVVQSRLHGLYDSQGRGQPPVSSHLALLLAILANICGAWALGSSPVQVFASQQDALELSTYWLRCTLDVLEHIWRTSTTDVEAIQASIMSFFLVYHMEGFSPKLRRLHVTTVTSAKDLGFHLIDSVHSKVKEDTQEQIIDADMRRRLWWHVASTDWSLSLLGGPHDGTYTIQRKHMQVKMPRNINDSDLATMPVDFERPMTEATDASYYLGRIRLGEACREAADVTWELQAVQDPEQIAYQRIVDLDRRLRQILSGLPPGMRIEDGVTAQIERNGLQLAKQKHFTFLTVQTRRCKLHLPFLLRAQRRSEYVFSRDVCLESARQVIAFRHFLPFQNVEKPGTFKMIGLLHHFYCAIVVLVMDLCVNRNIAQDIHARKTEIKEALAIFDDARPTSAAAGCFTEALSTMLKKHNVQLDSEKRYGYENPTMATIMCPKQATNAEGHSAGRQIGTFGDNLGIEDISFDDNWQSYFDFGTTPLEPAAWDALFNYEQDMGMPA